MRTAFSLILSLVIACTQLQAQVIPAGFFLTDYITRGVSCKTEVSLTPVHLAATTALFDLPLFFPITYQGSVIKPFNIQQPLYSQHALSAYFIGPLFSAAMQLKGDIQTNRYREDNQTTVQSGSTIINPISLADINHTRTDLSAATNTMIRIKPWMINLLLRGNLIQHYGYELRKIPVHYYRSIYRIQNFNPDAISGQATIGLSVAVPTKIFNSPMLTVAAITHTYTNEHTPLYASLAGTTDGRYESFQWYGARTDVDETQVVLASRPLEPENRLRKTMLYSGRYLYGIRMSEVSLAIFMKSLHENNVRYSSTVSADTSQFYFWETHYNQHDNTLTICPEIFLDSWLSVTINLKGIEGIVYHGHITEPKRQGESGSTIDISGALSLNMYKRWESGRELAITLCSGEMTTPVRFHPDDRPLSTPYFRSYLIALNVSFSGLR